MGCRKMTDFFNWLYLLVGHWQKWLSGGGLGGLVILLVYLLERFRGRTMPKRWYIIVFIVFYIIGASFVTWKDEHEQVVSLTQKLETKQKNREISDKIAYFINQGLVIQNQCAGHGPLYPNKTPHQAYAQWDREVGVFATKNLSDFEVAYLTNVYDEKPRRFTSEAEHTWHFVGIKIKRLEVIGKKYADVP